MMARRQRSRSRWAGMKEGTKMKTRYLSRQRRRARNEARMLGALILGVALLFGATIYACVSVDAAHGVTVDASLRSAGL